MWSFLVNKIGLFCSNNTYVLIMNLINNRQGTHNVSKKWKSIIG